MPGSWTWADAWTFIGVFIGIRIAFIWLATKAFIMMIPDGDCCPMCDGHTLPIQRDGWWKILGPRFRRSWCLDCGWEGVLRRKIGGERQTANGANGTQIAPRTSPASTRQSGLEDLW